ERDGSEFDIDGGESGRSVGSEGQYAAIHCDRKLQRRQHSEFDRQSDLEFLEFCSRGGHQHRFSDWFRDGQQHHYSDGSTQNLADSVTWLSSNASVAKINSMGFASGLGIGGSSIQAALGSVAGSTTLTVTAAALSSIVVSPANPSISDGTTQQFTATGSYTDGSTQNVTNLVTWGSSNPADSISASGLAAANGVGASIIQAALNGVNGSTTLTVTSTPPTISVTVTPS